MSGSDWGMASVLILVWASNFVVAAIGIRHVGPLALASLRFIFSAFPALFFVRFPKVALWRVAAFGLLFGLGQFGLLFVGIHQGVSVSIAALVIQMQAFFTALFAALLFAEKISRKNLLAFLIAASGLLLIGVKGGQSAPLIGILFILGGAASWALCNMIGRQVDRAEMVRFIIWSCAFAVPPLLLMTFIFEGYQPLLNSIIHPEPGLAAIVLWQAWANIDRRRSAQALAPRLIAAATAKTFLRLRRKGPIVDLARDH